MSFLISISNVTIFSKILKSKTIPHNLEQCMTRAIQTETQYQFVEDISLGRRTGPSPLKSVMVQEIDRDEDNLDNTIPRNDHTVKNACWICGEVGHYANKCPHNKNNIKNKGGKMTNMGKKCGDYTYTLIDKEPILE